MSNHATPGATAPTVSIITPAFNARRFIEETIRSVQAQTFTDWEMLVVDDGSQDDTRDIVQRIASRDPRVRLLASSGNRGPAAARNVGLTSGRGPYVAFLDSDDLWLPAKLEVQIASMRDQAAAFSFTSYSMIDEAGRPLGRPVLAPARLDYRGLLGNTLIGCLTVVLDVRKTGPVRMPDMPQHEDLALWYEILRRGIVAHGVPEVLARYRIVRGSASRDKLRSALHMWKVYREREHLSFPHAAWWYAQYAWNAYWKNRV